MRESYNLQSEEPGERNSDKGEKVDWWWGILLVLIIVVLIALVIVGFFDLTGTSNFDSDTEYFRRLRGGSRKLPNPIPPFKVESVLEVIETISKGNGLYNIEYDIQNRSVLLWDSNLSENCNGIQHMAIRVSAKNVTSNRTILVSGSFDESENGAKENGVAHAIIQSLIAITRESIALRHPVVLLLNRNLANYTQSVEGFMGQKHWARNISVFININSIPGGRGNVIHTRADATWLLKVYYGSFRHSHLCLICDEISKSNFMQIESNSRHYSIPRNLKGLDLTYAYGDNSIALSRESEVQNYMDDNILSLIRNVDSATEMDENYDSRNVVESIFFDFFGVFMVIYSETDGIIINVVVSFAALATMVTSMWLMQQWAVVAASVIWFQLAKSFAIQLASLIVGGGFAIFMAYLYDSYKTLLTWAPKHWMVFAIYFCPFLFIMCIFPSLYLNWKKYRAIPLRFGVMLFLHVNCILFIIAILTLTGLSVKTAFVIVSGIAFYTVSLMVVLAFKLYKKVYLWIFPIFVGQILPIAFVTYLMLIFYSVYIPVSSIPGAARRVQFLLALSAIGFSMLMFGFLIPILAIFRKSKTMLTGFVIITLIFLILIFTNVFAA